MNALFEVIVYRKFMKHSKDFHENIKQKFKELIIDLATNPVPKEKYDLKRIEGKDGHYRVRVAYARALYEVLWDEKIVKILKVERRDEKTYK